MNSPLIISYVALQVVESAKILGVHITSDLNWDIHGSGMLKKANGRLYMLKLLKHFNLPRNDLVTFFSGFLKPLAGHTAPVWHPRLKSDESDVLERI